MSVCGDFLISIQSQHEKIRNRKTPNTDTFYVVITMVLQSNIGEMLRRNAETCGNVMLTERGYIQERFDLSHEKYQIRLAIVIIFVICLLYKKEIVIIILTSWKLLSSHAQVTLPK